jgi:hypothetical protein
MPSLALAFSYVGKEQSMYASEKEGGRPVLRLCGRGQHAVRQRAGNTNLPDICNKEIPKQYPPPLHHLR